jgi:tetratricopeptide (TPR) repeat protein
MQGFSQNKPTIKRLGDLLLEAGFVTESDLNRAVDISKRNFQSLGKVLVSAKICREQDINTALEMQKFCKLENMSGSIAVRALTLVKKELLSVPEALNKVGWTHEGYLAYQEPDEIVAAKQEQKNLGTTEGVKYARALEKVGDAYLNCLLPARAEMKYEEAVAVCESALPGAARELSQVLTKLGKLAIKQKRHEDAKSFLDKAQACLEGTEHRQSKDYARVLHVSAEYHVSRRKFADAEKYFAESFDMLEPLYGLEDEHVLQTVHQYVAAIGGHSRERPETVTLGELLKGSGVLSEEQLTQAWQHGKANKLALGRALVGLGLITEKHLQIALQVQMLVRNSDLTARLGIWVARYAIRLDRDLEDILEILHCQPRSRGLLSAELKSATNEMANMEARLPANHPDLGFAHAKVGHIYFQRQQFVEADHHYKRALTIFSSSPVSYTEKALEVIDQYSDLKIAMEDYDESARIGKVAVVMRSKHYGQNSIPYAKGLEKLASLYAAKGDYPITVRCLDQALIIREKLYGTDARELIGCLESKGEALAFAFELTDAQAAFERALAIAEAVYGHAHDVTERITVKLVKLCKEAGNIDRASDLSTTTLADDLFLL